MSDQGTSLQSRNQDTPLAPLLSAARQEINRDHDSQLLSGAEKETSVVEGYGNKKPGVDAAEGNFGDATKPGQELSEVNQHGSGPRVSRSSETSYVNFLSEFEDSYFAPPMVGHKGLDNSHFIIDTNVCYTSGYGAEG